MVTVFLCGSEKENSMINGLLAAIHSVNAATLYITSKTVSLLPPDSKQPDFLILDNTNIHDLHMDKGIVLFKSDVVGYTDLDLPNDFLAIVESENDKAIEILKGNALHTILCGLSQRDTLTFSSLDAEHVVISLQREIKTLHGNSILPHEIPLTLSCSYGDYQLLAAVAVLLISEVPMPKDGLKF